MNGTVTAALAGNEETGFVILPSNMGIHRRDAKFAKVDLLTSKPQFP